MPIFNHGMRLISDLAFSSISEHGMSDFTFSVIFNH
jgi:hypothetical protein